MLMNIRQVTRRRRLMRSDNTYEAHLRAIQPSFSALVRESLVQTSWPISLSGDDSNDDDNPFTFRGCFLIAHGEIPEQMHNGCLVWSNKTHRCHHHAVVADRVRKE
ncbi:hypothetical protein BIW11_05566 [Tropilaelaps mercedesae]|uniref:Uncharacterized protein n=1 Tax=Tropilaelaps mercedesae TaxID=418985 RepID=A0A1V9Y1S0_9ACAR|nr:hypothetical protein BIW11_05566 [Tropilaelaps mercedesae]